MAPRGIVAAAVTAIFSLEFAHAVEEGRLGPEIGQVTHQMVPHRIHRHRRHGRLLRHSRRTDGTATRPCF